MAGSWTILHSTTFDCKFSEYAGHLEHYSPRDDGEDFVEKFRALQRFDQVSADLRKKSADPTTTLKHYARDLPV